ncbi:MAG: PEGA domain-containing protein [Acidobacteriota bacterium]|nr:PEGA domain-containing protein [Acidobacteriota bacterium]
MEETMRICSGCGATLQPGEKFCGVCGTRYEPAAAPPPPAPEAAAAPVCTGCGMTLQPGEKFCGVCGTRYEPAAAPPPPAPEAAAAPVCTGCGVTLQPGEKFCGVCGTRYEPAAAGATAATGVDVAAAAPPAPVEAGLAVDAAEPVAPAAATGGDAAPSEPDETAAPASEPATEAAAAPVCTGCGMTLQPGETFCGVCGTRYEPMAGAVAAAAATAPAPTPAPPVASGGEKSGSKKIVAIIAAAVVLLAAVGGAAWFFFLRDAGDVVVEESASIDAPAGIESLESAATPEELALITGGDAAPDADVTMDGASDETGFAGGAPSSSLGGFGGASRPSEPAPKPEATAPATASVQPSPAQPAPKQPKPEAAVAEQAGTVQPQPAQRAPESLTASLSVKTTPGGATILLDGKSIGRTNDAGELTREEIPPGRHEVLARLDGYADAKQAVQFAAGERQTARLSLNRLPGNLSVTVNVENANIQIKGAGTNATQRGKVSGLELPAGSYSVTVSKSGYKTVSRTVNVRPNVGESVSVVLEKSYTGPQSGTMVWEGEKRATAASTLVSITNGRADTGSVSGDPLPGVPCKVQLSGAQDVSVAVAPDADNQYRKVILRVAAKGKVKVTINWEVSP